MKSHNNSLNCNTSRNYFNSRNNLVILNTITRRLYLIFKTRLLPSIIHARLTNSSLVSGPIDRLPLRSSIMGKWKGAGPCHRKRPPPVRRQSPTTTTCCRYATSDHYLRPASRTIYNPRPNNNIRSTYPNSYDRYNTNIQHRLFWATSMHPVYLFSNVMMMMMIDCNDTIKPNIN